VEGGLRVAQQAVLRSFASTARPPSRAELDRALRPCGADPGAVLAWLDREDYIGLDAAGRVAVAYPFSVTPTPHSVAIGGGPTVWAMCAIDALGIPVMVGTDATISSTDPGNGQPVTVTFRAGQARWDPPSAVVFLTCGTGEGPASVSCCGQLNMFTDPRSARAWAQAHPDVAGTVTDQATAQRLGADIFGALLTTDP
jgi:hypothetical protein